MEEKKLFYLRLICIFVAVGTIALVGTIVTVVPKFNSVMNQAETVLSDVSVQMENLEKLDMESLNNMIKQSSEKIDTIDVDTLNSAITGFSEVVEDLSTVSSSIAGLFGRK